MSSNQIEDSTSSELTIVNPELDFPQVSLENPTSSSYVHLAAEVDSTVASFLPVFLFESRKKRRLIAACKELCRKLSENEWVVEAPVFKATIIPPGRGEYLEKTDKKVHIARFDVAVLIEVVDAEALQQLRVDETYLRLEELIIETSSHHHIVSATNIKRIGPVDHETDGLFLFNYFFADDRGQNIAIWEYTAGWFESETGLDNSTLLLPDDPEQSEYALINHCRWDGLLKLLPALIFDRTFDDYVLKNFKANRVAANPILYKLA